MRTVLVTSAVTFVPNNYDSLVLPLAHQPSVVGLIIVDNRSFDIVLKALALLFSGAAPALGWQLIKNYFDKPLERKQKYYETQGKKVWILKDINSEESLQLIQSLAPDILLNARTRAFFRKKLLAIPKWGAINIHHGLLPDQRGLMCDFWAHLFKTPAGFSIHQMTSKLDDGAILKVVPVVTEQKDYLLSIELEAQAEAEAAKQILEDLKSAGRILGQENLKTEKTVYRSNPRLRDFYRLRFMGVRI